MSTETSHAKNDRQEIVGIQYLRGMAAFLVLIVHSDHMLHLDKYLGRTFIGTFSNGGNLGVDLFFVISGFIMYHITRGFSKETKSGEFLWRRFIRIVPFMWLCIIAVYVMRSGLRGYLDPTPYLRGFFLWPVGDVDPNPVWTLRHELFFYLCTYLCLAYRRGSWLLWAFLLLPIPLFLLRMWTGHLNSEWIGNFFSVQANTSFAMGIGLAWLYGQGWVVRNKQIGKAIVLAAPLALLSFEYFVTPMMVGSEASDPASATSANALAIALRCGLITILSGCIVYASLSCNPGSSMIERFGLVVGNASYSIYLTHESVISIVAIVFAKLKLHDFTVVAGIGSILLALAVGILVHYRIEKPLIKALRARFG